LIAFDEGGARDAPERLILACNIEDGGKLVIRGRDGFRRNIDAAQNAGRPCAVEREYRPPKSNMAQRSGHTHRVPQNALQRVVRERDVDR